LVSLLFVILLILYILILIHYNTHKIITDDAPKQLVQSREQRKKDLKIKKSKERASSEVASRGFSTDQRISIESLNINRQRLTHQKEETRLVGLSIHESAIGRQIESAEARAKDRCPKYNPKNIYWKRVDELLEKQAGVTDNMGTYTESLMQDNKNNKVMEVSEFLNQPSPQKMSSKRSFDDMKGDSSVIVFDDESQDDEGLSVKLEKIKQVTEKGPVSYGSRKRRKR